MEEDDAEDNGLSHEYMVWLESPLTRELLRWARGKHAECEKHMVASAVRASDMDGVARTRFYAGGFKLSEAFIARMEKGK